MGRTDESFSHASSKNFFETWLDEKIGNRSCSTTRGKSWPNNPKVHNQAKQIQTQIMIERWNSLFAVMQITSTRTQEIKTRFFSVKNLWNMIKRWDALFCRDANQERSMLNEIDIDFRKPDCHILLRNKLILSCSWIGQEDREQPSPIFFSTRSTTKQSPQPVQDNLKNSFRQIIQK